MKAKSITKIKILSKPILFLIIFFIATSASAWNPPTSSPTGNNVVPVLNLSNTFQEKFGILNTFGGIAVTFWIRITDGNQALNKILASDVDGFGNWKTIAQVGGVTNVMTTLGDIIYGGVNGVPTRLAGGQLDYVLTSNGPVAAPSWKAIPAGGGGGNVSAGGGSGTANYITKWVGTTPSTTIDDSQIFDNGTNVGVGTASPATKLDVAGTAKMTGFQLGNSTTAGYVLTANASGVGTWQVADEEGGLSSGTNGDTIRYGTSGWEANNFLYNDGTKIGIGTTAPTEQLEIAGNFKMQDSNYEGFAGIIYRPNLEPISGRFLHNNGGTNSTFIGERAGYLGSIPIGNGNTGIGFYSMIWSSDGNNNTAFSHHTLIGTTFESNNTAVGRSHVGIGSNNTNIGHDSLFFGFNEPCCQVDQDNNTAIGHGALNYDVETLNVPTTRNNNTSVGALSMGTNKAGSTNTALGYNAEINLNNLTNTIVIGAGATVNANNTTVFGKNATAGWGFGVQPGGSAIKVGAPGTAGNGASLTQSGTWTNVSDRTKKYNIEDISYGLDEVLALHPVEFNWNLTNKKDIGFIAQEVKEIIPEVVRGVEGDMTLSYDQLASVLGEAVKELKAKNDILKSEMDYLELEAKKRNL